MDSKSKRAFFQLHKYLSLTKGVFGPQQKKFIKLQSLEVLEINLSSWFNDTK